MNVDKNGKIYTDDTASTTYKAISEDTLEFYTSKTKSLWKAGHRVQALTIAKSIIALKETSMNVIKAKKDINVFLRQIQMKEGERYIDINLKAWLYLTKEENIMYVFNDKVPFILQCKGNAEVIAAQSVDSFQHSITVMRSGIRFANSNGYDAIMTVVAERFADTIESITTFQQHLNTVAFDTFQRTLLQSNDTMALYSFVTADAYSLMGLELLRIKENRGYLLRIFTTKEKYELYKQDIATIVQSFSTP